jgi:hypothetical protein
MTNRATVLQILFLILSDGAAGGTLARLLAPSASGSTLSAIGKRASLGRAPSTDPTSSSGSSTPYSHSSSSTANAAAPSTNATQSQAENLAQDMADLMHDFDAVSRVANLIGTMRAR